MLSVVRFLFTKLARCSQTSTDDSDEFQVPHSKGHKCNGFSTTVQAEETPMHQKGCVLLVYMNALQEHQLVASGELLTLSY